MVKTIGRTDGIKCVDSDETSEDAIAPQSQVLLEHKSDLQRFVNSYLFSGNDADVEASLLGRRAARKLDRCFVDVKETRNVPIGTKIQRKVPLNPNFSDGYERCSLEVFFQLLDDRPQRKVAPFLFDGGLEAFQCLRCSGA